MKVETISVKYLNKKDIKPDETYVIGFAKVAKNRAATIEAYTGVKTTRYRYYNTKGYFGLQTLLFDQVMGKHNTYPICFVGSELLKAWPNMIKSKHPFVVVSEKDFDAYSDFLYNKKDMDEVQEKYNNEWDWTCHERQPEKIFAGEYGAFSLPRHLARDLKSNKDWEMAKRAHASWRTLKDNGILDNSVVHND